MPGQERAAAKAPGDRDSGTYNHKPKGRQKAARNSNIALHSITHTYRMERLPGIEPRYERNGLPYSYHINKDTKEKIASGLKVTIRQKTENPGACLPQAAGFSGFHVGLYMLTYLFPQRFCHLLIFFLRESHFLHIVMERLPEKYSLSHCPGGL